MYQFVLIDLILNMETSLQIRVKKDQAQKLGLCINFAQSKEEVFHNTMFFGNFTSFIFIDQAFRMGV